MTAASKTFANCLTLPFSSDPSVCALGAIGAIVGLTGAFEPEGGYGSSVWFMWRKRAVLSPSVGDPRNSSKDELN